MTLMNTDRGGQAQGRAGEVEFMPGRADRTGQDRTRIPITVRSEARGAITAGGAHAPLALATT